MDPMGNGKTSRMSGNSSRNHGNYCITPARAGFAINAPGDYFTKGG